jgi:nucleotide-binding universal stress UspA family protein
MAMAARIEQRGGRPAGQRADTTAAEVPFQRLLVAVDGTDAAAGAEGVAREWAQKFGGVVRQTELSGARNEAVVREVANAAVAFGADVIVLGCDRRRLARHRLGHSLREALTRATDLPVLVVPGAASKSGRRRATPGGHAEGGARASRRSARV